MTTEIVVTENSSPDEKPEEEFPVEVEEAASLALAADAVALSEQVAASAELQAAEREAENIRRIETWQAEMTQALQLCRETMAEIRADLVTIRSELENLSIQKSEPQVMETELPVNPEGDAGENPEPKTKPQKQRRWI